MKLPRFTLKMKTIIGIATIEALLLGILIYTALHMMTSSINEGLSKRAFTASTLFAETAQDALLTHDLASLEAYSQQMLKNPDVVYARVLNAQGQVLAYSHSDTYSGSEYHTDQSIADVDDGIFDTFAEISASDMVYGRVEIGISTTTIESSIAQIKRNTSLIAGIEMLLVALFSWMLGTYLTSQLNTLRKGAIDVSAAVTDGRFSSSNRIPITSSDEIADVSLAFNKLIDNLELEFSQKNQFEMMLQDFNRDLEEKVQKRTSELEQKNSILEQTNDELHAAQKQLLHAEKMASVGQLAAGVAHEINNPVGYVLSNVKTLGDYVDTFKQVIVESQSLMQQSPQLNPHMKKLVDEQNLDFITEDIDALMQESKQGLQRVQDIVMGLKSFSHADTDQLQKNDINDCLRSTLSMVHNELKYHCEVTTDFCQDGLVSCNAGKMSQVFTNLLVNAGQAIELEGKIKVKTMRDMDYVRIFIADNGSGIAPEHLKHLFDPFFTTKAEGEGTGLGLSISYGIVRDHGGDIEVKSEVGKGTCFIISLPVYREASEKPSEVTSENA
ncbi:MAG: HAMP domain-containing protein [Alteromonadaceae bacterium]|nr:HAMP domain-containing protein [Alteromonadaceae bacterium]